MKACNSVKSRMPRSPLSLLLDSCNKHPLLSIRVDSLQATMLKKRKRRKVNRRHTEPGLGASSGVAGEGGPAPCGGAVQSPPSSSIPGVSETSSSSTTVVPSVGGLNSSASASGSGSGVSSGGKSRRALTALRSEAAMGASQYTLHSQVHLAFFTLF